MEMRSWHMRTQGVPGECVLRFKTVDQTCSELEGGVFALQCACVVCTIVLTSFPCMLAVNL